MVYNSLKVRFTLRKAKKEIVQQTLSTRLFPNSQPHGGYETCLCGRSTAQFSTKRYESEQFQSIHTEELPSNTDSFELPASALQSNRKNMKTNLSKIATTQDLIPVQSGRQIWYVLVDCNRVSTYILQNQWIQSSNHFCSPTRNIVRDPLRSVSHTFEPPHSVRKNTATNLLLNCPMRRLHHLIMDAV